MMSSIPSIIFFLYCRVNRLRPATKRRQRAIGIAGIQDETDSPAGMFFVMLELKVIITLSPTTICPRILTAPPIIQFFPITALPATPVQPQMTVLSPM